MIQEPLQQEILSRIDKLAEKLGVTAEYLWPHLVRYEVAQGISIIVAAGLFIILTGITWWRFTKTDDIDFETAWSIAAVLFSVVALVLLIIAVTAGIPALIAPEASAFKALLPN